jgi:hypothetical protein
MDAAQVTAVHVPRADGAKASPSSAQDMKRTAALVTLLLAVSAAIASSAGADPLNKNSVTFGFACDNGVTFTDVGIAQSKTSTGHVIESSDSSLLNSVFQAVQITDNGQVVKQIPGFAGRSLVNCTLVSEAGEPVSGDVVVATGFFTGEG